LNRLARWTRPVCYPHDAFQALLLSENSRFHGRPNEQITVSGTKEMGQGNCTGQVELMQEASVGAFVKAQPGLR